MAKRKNSLNSNQLQKLSIFSLGLFLVVFGIYGAYQKQHSKALTDLVDKAAKATGQRINQINNPSFETSGNIVLSSDPKCSSSAPIVGYWCLELDAGKSLGINRFNAGTDAQDGSFVMSVQGKPNSTAQSDAIATISQKYSIKTGCTYNISVNYKLAQATGKDNAIISGDHLNYFQNANSALVGQWQVLRATVKSNYSGVETIYLSAGSADSTKVTKHFWDDILITESCI